jgi:hypothetical protein
MSSVTQLNSGEVQVLAVKIARLLNGVPLGQALAIVEQEVPLLIKDAHVVEVNNPRFKRLATTSVPKPGGSG